MPFLVLRLWHDSVQLVPHLSWLRVQVFEDDAIYRCYPSHPPEFQQSLEHSLPSESRLPVMACAFISHLSLEDDEPILLNDPTIVLPEDTNSTLPSPCGPRRLGMTYVLA